MNLEIAKENMVKQQIRPNDIEDERVIGLFETIDRADFVAPEHQDLAYADLMLPINCGQFMLSPTDQAKILQALALKKHETVLEIGTGNGYLTALLAKLAKSVTSVEIYPELKEEAEQHLARLHIHNANLQVGNGANGWELEPVDVIVITGSLPFLPEAFKLCLREHGRVLAILGENPVMDVCLIKLDVNHTYISTPLFEVNVPVLEKAL